MGKLLKKICGVSLAFALICALLPGTAARAADIAIGDYVQMGTYYGAPILWRCVDIDENGPLMLSDKIICLKAFDAGGDNTSGSHARGYYKDGTQGYYRRQYGSNYWADSNIRCWLNSAAPAGGVVWACGNPPDNVHVWNGYNDYAEEAGFLSDFTQGELNAIKEVTLKSLLDGYEYADSLNNKDPDCHGYNETISDVLQNYDTAFSEQLTEHIFLPDVKQINAVYDNREVLGDKYYIGGPTAQCVQRSEYKDVSLAAGSKWLSWLRSPDASYDSCTDVRSVGSGGRVYYDSAYYGYGGVRPAFYMNLSSVSLAYGSGTAASPYMIGEPVPQEVYLSGDMYAEVGGAAKMNVAVASDVPMSAAVIELCCPAELEPVSCTAEEFKYADMQKSTNADGTKTVTLTCQFSDGEPAKANVEYTAARLRFTLSHSAAPGVYGVTVHSALVYDEEYNVHKINSAARMDITVLPKLVESITVSGPDEAWGSASYTARVLPENAADKTVTWSVDDESIAAIDASGRLTAKRNGSVTVTAAANDGSGVAGKKTVTVCMYAPIDALSTDIGEWNTAFSPDVYDYIVYAGAGAQSIKLTAAFTGGSLKLNGALMLNRVTKTAALDNYITELKLTRTNAEGFVDSVYTVMVCKAEKAPVCAAYTRAGNVYTVNVMLDGEAACGGVLTAAAYDADGRLICARRKAVQSGARNTDITLTAQGAECIKLFISAAVDGITPVCPCAEAYGE